MNPKIGSSRCSKFSNPSRNLGVAVAVPETCTIISFSWQAAQLQWRYRLAKLLTTRLQCNNFSQAVSLIDELHCGDGRELFAQLLGDGHAHSHDRSGWTCDAHFHYWP